MKVLVTGVSGLLGINLSLQMAGEHTVYGVFHEHRLQNTPFELIGADLTDEKKIKEILDITQPEVIINCAALANLDICEAHPQAAQRINTDMPRLLAKAAYRSGIKLVHISTDCVFDGLQGNYSEDDLPNPRGVYARTKYEAEQHVLGENPQALIARVNFYGCSLTGTRSLAEWFYQNLSAGVRIMGFTDMFYCPLYVDDLSSILWRMVMKGLTGLYHLVSSECLSKYDFGVMLAKQFGLDANLIQPTSWKEAGLRATRSPNLCLDTNKLQLALGEALPRQAEGLSAFHSKILRGFPQQLMTYMVDVK